MRYLILSIIIILTGCEQKNIGGETTVVALPLIQDAIAKQIPVFNGRWQRNIMDKICQLASGENDREMFTNWFSSKNVDVSKLAEKDSGFEFLVQIDESKARKACAAWIISSILSPDQAWGEDLSSEGAYQEKMAAMTPLIKEVANTLASIAAKTSESSYLSEQAYQQIVSEEFSLRANDFIKKTLNSSFVLDNYRKPGAMSMMYDYRLIQGNGQVIYNGTTWLGDGNIKGWRYTVKIKN